MMFNTSVRDHTGKLLLRHFLVLKSTLFLLLDICILTPLTMLHHFTLLKMTVSIIFLHALSQNSKDKRESTRNHQDF